MPESLFHFKQFSIAQDLCAMKVGTDGVLLGAWSHAENAERILDAGCGTGLIALMMAQKSNAIIDAIDIDASAIEQATLNIQASKWKERMHLCRTSIQEYAKHSILKYDLIISNPPFFQDAFKPPDISRATARHNNHLSYNDLLCSSFSLLDDSGRLCLILPVEKADTVNRVARESGFYMQRRCYVIPKPGKKAKRLLVEFAKTPANEIKEEELMIENEKRHQYTAAYIALTKKFYLKF